MINVFTFSIAFILQFYVIF
jgi:hypothetical protein